MAAIDDFLCIAPPSPILTPQILNSFLLILPRNSFELGVNSNTLVTVFFFLFLGSDMTLMQELTKGGKEKKKKKKRPSRVAMHILPWHPNQGPFKPAEM